MNCKCTNSYSVYLGVSSNFWAWAKNTHFWIFPFLITFGYRGYECFTKYSTKPQSNKISYKFNAGVPFPLILFCPDDDDMFKAEELTKCSLIQDDYFENGQWVGKSKDSYCMDPKAFYLWFILLCLREYHSCPLKCHSALAFWVLNICISLCNKTFGEKVLRVELVS